MEDFNCSDSSSEMNGKDNLICNNNDLQKIMATEGFDDEEEEDIINTDETNCRSIGQKKKRLSIDQVQGLERIFETDSKLDQERKIKLAQELGLQPRQVAIWFQNRRARWKTKQLERDFRLLKANYESLQLNYSQIEREKEGLVAELRGLKEKLGEENSVEKASPATTTENQEVYDYTNYKPTEDFKERRLLLSSDDNSDYNSTSRLLLSDDQGLIMMDQSSSAAFPSSSTTTSSSSLMDSSSRGELMTTRGYYFEDEQQQQQQNNFFNSNGDESCSLMMMMPPLPIDQAPFFWYFSDKSN